jgi:hypothetical protein
VAKIKTVELTQLAPVKKERKPSPRQIALIKREAEYEKAISRVQLGQAISFEPSEEKLPALRASLQRVIDRNARKSELHLAIISGIAYVALEKIPGSRGPRSSSRKKTASAE